MSKKETLSKAELQEMTGLDFSEQNSQTEESRMMEVDAAFGNLPVEDNKSESIPLVAEQVQTEAEPPFAEEQPSAPTIQRRVSSKQRKLSLEEYRKMLDKFACKIGEDRMSMSGLLENIVRHHIELYSEDFEHWKGM